MNASQQGLLERLIVFEVDEPGAELTFARRLARENAWSSKYAERVVVEYKKFLFLAVEAGHVVSPSEQVDQAWHLHLTYTHSYWDDLCGKVLGRPLHHGPTKGGAAEQARFIDLYNQTLVSYRRLFDREPPCDIWSPTKQRFGEDLRHVSVNTLRYWIVPKPRFHRWTFASQVASLCLVGMPLVSAAWNPLDWRGPEFLIAYVAVAIMAALCAVAVRLLLAPNSATIDAETLGKLFPDEVACLVGGRERAVHATFAAMVQADTLRLIAEETKTLGIWPQTITTIRQGKPMPADASRLEQALFDAAAAPAPNLAPLTSAGLPIARDIEESLQERGLLQSGLPSVPCVLAGLIMAAPLLLGLAKIAVGVSRGRPVAFLVILCLVTAVAAIAFVFTRSRLSARGKAAINSLRAKHASLTQRGQSKAATLSPTELAMAIGLFGVGMLESGPLANVHAMLPRAYGGGDCNGGISTDGGGGCGGGGCGGGGCGGCGGG